MGTPTHRPGSSVSSRTSPEGLDRDGTRGDGTGTGAGR